MSARVHAPAKSVTMKGPFPPQSHKAQKYTVQNPTHIDSRPLTWPREVIDESCEDLSKGACRFHSQSTSVVCDPVFELYSFSMAMHMAFGQHLRMSRTFLQLELFRLRRRGRWWQRASSSAQMIGASDSSGKASRRLTRLPSVKLFSRFHKVGPSCAKGPRK